MVGSLLRVCLSVFVTLAILVPYALADEAEIRRIVQEEIKAAADKKKEDEGEVMKVKWKDGLKFESNNKLFKVHVGGRIFLDGASYSDSDWVDNGGTPQENSFEFRAARLEVSGDLYEHTEFKIQVDFADPVKGSDNDVEVSFKDVYLGVKNLKDCYGCLFPNIRIGHLKEPFSLEQMTSARYTTFMERALPDVFAPGRNVGLQFYDSLRGDQITYAVGIFANSNDGGFGFFDEQDDALAFTGRVTWAPWYDCNCPCKRFHVGASYSYRTDIGDVRYRQRPEIHLQDRLVDTTSFDADRVNLFGLEFAWVYGPFSMQGEYIQADVQSDVADDPSFSGWYVYASYFITGECRNYSKGVFDRVRPCANFLGSKCCGAGAWEVALRYSTLDLNDKAIAGGEEQNWTLGVNWHLNPAMRVMGNFVFADIQDGVGGVSGELGIFGLRFQVDF